VEPNNKEARRTALGKNSRRSLQLYEEHITAPNLLQPAPGKHLSDLQKQGFSANQERNSYQPYDINFGTKSILTSSPQTLKKTL
jgi:hypothetical protein